MKDWRTLTAEDGIIARYLLRLDAARIEQWNRDLVRMLLQGGRKMRLKEEVKEAMRGCAVAYCKAAGDSRPSPMTVSATFIAAGTRSGSTDTSGLVAEVLKAADTVLDQYKEVEVEECRFRQDGLQMHVLRFCDSHSFGKGYGDPVSRTIYMRKPEPAPDLKELARRAVKAWRSSCGVPVCETMEALEKELDE